MLNYSFFFISTLCCLCAYLAISQKSSIHAICSLIFVFVSASFLLFFIGADFLAFTYIIVYVGAISVFFLFAVMLLDLKSDETIKQMIAYLPIHAFFIISNWIIFHLAVMKTPRLDIVSSSTRQCFDNIRRMKKSQSDNQLVDIDLSVVEVDRPFERAVMKAFMPSYVYPFHKSRKYTIETIMSDVLNHGISLYSEFGILTILLGCLLFLAMVGVICLTFEYAKAFTKRQFVYEQHNTLNTIVLIS